MDKFIMFLTLLSNPYVLNRECDASSIDLPLFNHLIELMTSSDNWSRDSNGGL